MQPQHKSTPWSFITLMAMLMSFIALSIDAMLPALGLIGADLHVSNPNDVQFVISSIFLGMGFGLMFFGPFSDSFGRKPAIYLGMIIFAFGCLVSIFSTSFEIMLIGRIFQGLGAASCRVITLAMIRDRFEGNEMAKIMSLVMIFFILVPALAPSIGQAIILFTNWRMIFVLILSLGAICMIWLTFGVNETLKKENRLPFKFKTITHGIKETCLNKTSRGYTLSAGLIFGAFIGYLSSSQQILQVQYDLGKLFSIAFGFLALSVGLASFANSRWVEKLGMVYLCKKALSFLVGAALIFLPVSLFFHGKPPFLLFMLYLMITFFCFGILIGNFNALAIQPLGHIAGVANSVISSFQTLLSVLLGGTLGALYNGTIIPLVSGFLVLGTLSLILVVRVSKSASALEASHL